MSALPSSRYIAGPQLPWLYRPVAQAAGCTGHQFPRIYASCVDWAHSQSYIACWGPVARLQQWSAALLPQAYTITCSIPRLGALPGLQRMQPVTGWLPVTAAAAQVRVCDACQPRQNAPAPSSIALRLWIHMRTRTFECLMRRTSGLNFCVACESN